MAQGSVLLDRSWRPIDGVGAMVNRFGDDELVVAHNDRDRVQFLVKNGHVVTPNALFAACFAASPRILEILLSTGLSPDARLDFVDSNLAEVEDGWADTDITPYIGIEKRECFPLQHAASGVDLDRQGGKERRASALNVLLNYKPDLYATFKQPIWRRKSFPFPGEGQAQMSVHREHEGYAVHNRIKSMWQIHPIPELGYGVCSVIHAIFECGAYVKPILEHLGLEIDVNRRDPQGRTLLHSVCRNEIGADPSIDVIEDDVYWIADKPFQLSAPDESESSLFHTI